MKKKNQSAAYARPEAWMVLGFLTIIAVGTVLLALPRSSRTGQRGGLGFMMFAAFFMHALGRRLSLRGRLLMRDAVSAPTMSHVGHIAINFMKVALGIEFIGAVLLAIRFIPREGFPLGLWHAVFHAISAFCNAGFDLFGGFSSLTSYAHDPLVLLTISAMILLGGLGFLVIIEFNEILFSSKKMSSLTLHSRLVLNMTLALTVFGTLFFLLTEWNNPGTLGEMNAGSSFLNAFFQSVTLRTAGFNSVDQDALRDGSKLFSCLMMLIGASPASTGGGMKTTTAAAFILLVRSIILDEDDVNISKRRLSKELTGRALAIASIFVTMFLVGSVLIALIENGRFPLSDILFEIASALGTVGVSSIGTPNLSLLSRSLLIPMMFLGRVGPLTLAVTLSRHRNTVHSASSYPEEKILIG